MRLENLLDGLEDYDLLYLARARRDALRGRKVTALAALEARIAPYFVPENSLVRTLTDFTQDPVELETVRGLLADYCQAARSVTPD